MMSAYLCPIIINENASYFVLNSVCVCLISLLEQLSFYQLQISESGSNLFVCKQCTNQNGVIGCYSGTRPTNTTPQEFCAYINNSATFIYNLFVTFAFLSLVSPKLMLLFDVFFSGNLVGTHL